MHNNLDFFYFLAKISYKKRGSRGTSGKVLILKVKKAGGEANPEIPVYHLNATIDASFISFSHFFFEPVRDAPIVHVFSLN